MKDFYWLNRDSRTFLKRGYLEDGETPEDRIKHIADSAQETLAIPGFSEKFQKNKDEQILELKKYLKNWKSKKNLVLITHYVVILETLNKAVSSGEIVIADKNLNFIGSISDY